LWVRFGALLGTLAAALLLAACSSVPIPRPQVPGDAPLELTATPFFPQREHHCGPAALATVLGASGVVVQPDQLAPALYVPDRRGTFQVELAALPRRYERMAVQVDATLDSLVHQLQLGRPVLVLQNLAIERLPRWHYAVVVGYLPEEDRFVLRSGTRRRMLVSRERFLATWVRAGRWGIVVVSPDARPDGLAAGAWLKAAAGLESAGHYAAALAAFESALALWPDDPTVQLGRANNLYRLGRYGAAEQSWRAVLALAPDHPVGLHNLAMLLVEEGRSCAALAVLPERRVDEPALVTAARAAATAAAASSDCP
jgi:tetratricopeptide (TPR) repeat protein